MGNFTLGEVIQDGDLLLVAPSKGGNIQKNQVPSDKKVSSYFTVEYIIVFSIEVNYELAIFEVL